MEKVEIWAQYALDLLKQYGPQVLYSLLTLVVGLWIINLLMKLLQRSLSKRKLDDSLKTFIGSGISILLKTLLVITVISMLGIKTSSFVAILGAAGLAVGLALSGTLQNFAGGVMIIIFKPYKVGDYIEAQGHSGIVTEVQIFNTLLKTPDNKKIIIPNGGLATNSLVNFTAEETRRVDITFGIGYDDDIDKAREVILRVINSQQLLLKDPEPFVGVIELGDNSVNLVTRVWAKTADYWDAYFFLQETVKKEFDKENISIPYPQRDVHLYEK